VVRAYQKRKTKPLASKLESTTLRGFGGGWNAIDEDLSMPPKYQARLVNFHRTSSGAQAVRFGQKFIMDIRYNIGSNIVDGYYFNGFNVIVTESGHVCRVSLDGSFFQFIFYGWAATTIGGAAIKIKQVSFVPFKDTLIIHNGQTKPMVIKSDFTTNYLQDAGGSNVNVPIGRYGCVAANYHCVAHTVYTNADGSVAKYNPTEIIISSKGTSGTFPLDPAPNDSTSIDVGAYAPEGAASIRGIAGFRTYLLVFLQNITLQVKLGEYNDAATPVHTPKFPDTLPQFGILSNRGIVTVENDIMFSGLSGMASAKRNLYSPDSITSDYLSSIIAPAFRQIVGAMSDDDQLNKTFATYDRLNNDFLLFLPNGRVLCYTFNPRLKMHSWSEYADMNFTAGWTSVLGRVFLVSGTKIFLSGNGTFTGENFYADAVGDRHWKYSEIIGGAWTFGVGHLMWDDLTGVVWKCIKQYNHTVGSTFALERENHPDSWEVYEGRPIQIDFELPWIDGKDPMKLKQLRNISIATKGDAEFTFDAYVDNLYKDVRGNLIHNPCVSMTFIGNDAYGYGFIDDTPTTGYGMGRRSRDPRLYGLPLKFKSIKFRIHGSTSKKLELINLSFLYAFNKHAGFLR
jgi:hypothetical protein